MKLFLVWLVTVMQAAEERNLAIVPTLGSSTHLELDKQCPHVRQILQHIAMAAEISGYLVDRVADITGPSTPPWLGPAEH